MTEIQQISVNINESTAEELISVKGIGESLAQRIIDHRPYKDIHELVKVPGINEVKLATLQPYLSILKPEDKITQTREIPAENKTASQEPIIRSGVTEAFLFLENKRDKENAFLIILGGFIFGLFILLLRRNNH